MDRSKFVNQQFNDSAPSSCYDKRVGRESKPAPHLESKTRKRVPPNHFAPQCISGMKTVLRGVGFRQWELSERPHWGKAPGIPCVSALWNPRERATECRKAKNAVLCRRNADQSAASAAGQ